MLSRHISRWAIILLIGLSTTFALAAKPTVFDIPKLSNIKIDGDSSDWGNRGFCVAVMADTEGRSKPVDDLDSNLHLGWNEQGLLVFVTVLDSIVCESPDDGNLWQGDSIELFASPKLNSSESVQVLIAPGVSTEYTKPRHFFWGNPGIVERFKSMKIELAGKKIAGGYTYEVMLPWSDLGITPKEGLEIPFQTYTNDLDSIDRPDPFQIRWYPADVIVANLSVSAYLVRLSRQAGSPVSIWATGRYEGNRSTCVKVVAEKGLIGKPVIVKEAGKIIGSDKLIEHNGRAGAEITLPMPERGATYGEIAVQVGSLPATKLTLPNANEVRARELVDAKVIYNPYCFTDTSLPPGDLENPGLVNSLVGSYTSKSRYYGADFQPVTNADKSGRYGAILELQSEAGRPIRRFRTLYRMAQDTSQQPPLVTLNLESFGAMGIKPAAVEADSDNVKEFYGWRIGEVMGRDQGAGALMAGLYESGADAVKRDFSNNIWATDRQWWVTMKRKFYGVDKVYDKPFVSPRKLAGTPAPVVHEGTPAEAGMKPDAAAGIDKVCQEWAADSDEAFGVCIVRHGVIVLHKAYGTRDGKPMTLASKSWMASITKPLAASLLMQMVDQGLVSLDDPVEKFLPALRGVKVETPLTVRHLYTHTNGMSGHWGDEMNDMEEVIADIYPYLEVGQRHEYNGVGYALGSKIVETISGEALPQFYKHHLLDPLGMTNTTVTSSSWDAQSTPLDMAKFGQMLLNGGAYGDQLFFSKETFNMMLPEKLTKVLDPDTSIVWGIGLCKIDWLANEAISPEAFGHGAASNATLAIDPTNDMVIVMTRNTAGKKFGIYNPRFFHAIAEGMMDLQR